MTPQDPAANDVLNLGSGTTQAQSDSLVPILSNQRDRFRLRVQELEEVNQQFY